MHDRFSNRPIKHYCLAIGLTSILATLALSIRTFDCLSAGNTYDCEYEPGSPAMTVFSKGSPDLLHALGTTAITNVVLGLFLFVTFLITNIPVYALAHHASCRFHVRRNALGCALWIAAWTIAFLIGPILGGMRDLFDSSHVSWRFADLSFVLEFGIAGISCGIAYCALALFSRAAPSN